VIHHERDVREEQHYIHVVGTSNNRVVAAHDLYCCLLPQCEALRTCRSGFPIETVLLQSRDITYDIHLPALSLSVFLSFFVYLYLGSYFF